MFLKFAVLIISLGACACTLLAMRQSRLQAAHELAEAQLRIRVHDERLWRVRSEIAMRVSPAHVELMAADLGPTHPLLPPTTLPLAITIPGLEPGDAAPRLPAIPGVMPQGTDSPGPRPTGSARQTSAPGAKPTSTTPTGTGSKPVTERQAPGNGKDAQPSNKPSGKPPSNRPHRSRLADRSEPRE